MTEVEVYFRATRFFPDEFGYELETVESSGTEARFVSHNANRQIRFIYRPASTENAACLSVFLRRELEGAGVWRELIKPFCHDQKLETEVQFRSRFAAFMRHLAKNDFARVLKGETQPD